MNASVRATRGAALCALLILAASGCGSSGGKSPPADAATQTDARVDVAPEAAPLAHCCVLAQPADGSACGAIYATQPLTSEPCWGSNAAGSFGRWACGGAADGGVTCSDDGRSCAVGATCLLVDVGCAGTVQTCTAQPGGPLDGGRG